MDLDMVTLRYLFSLMIQPPPKSTLFPYTTLFRSDQYNVDYVILARYMRILSPASCWKYAGGRIINLHHGLLPSFPGMRPYHDAYAARMLTYGATCHFIVPELDAGNQIINQSSFTVPPGTTRDDVIRQGEQQNEPQCLVEGVRRVVDGEVGLHFNRVVATRQT